eukprot:TRINITY_DN4952_c0_g1_i1.p1 TRINITY_DN4952_c0_g1~~TRINITY_DN4952_c0_g1_i1.p1  ORF type:complete len:572 (-),score=65.48 TRINITY_DN4952_c0_g1_i1:441-2156(-)
MIRRPPRSTLSSSSAASDVYKRQVGDPGRETRWVLVSRNVQVIQLGICVFRRCAHPESSVVAYNATDYSIMVYSHAQDSTMQVQLSSLKFLRNHQFDLNRLVGHGCGYSGRVSLSASLDDLWPLDKVLLGLARTTCPVVGHNCLRELMMMVDQFFAPGLPVNSAEFKRQLLGLFGVVIDTKMMATALKGMEGLPTRMLRALDSTDLGSLFNGLNQSNEQVIVIKRTGTEAQTDPASSGQHDAGYDAYMTGVVALQLGVGAVLVNAGQERSVAIQSMSGKSFDQSLEQYRACKQAQQLESSDLSGPLLLSDPLPNVHGILYLPKSEKHFVLTQQDGVLWWAPWLFSKQLSEGDVSAHVQQWLPGAAVERDTRVGCMRITHFECQESLDHMPRGKLSDRIGEHGRLVGKELYHKIDQAVVLVQLRAMMRAAVTAKDSESSEESGQLETKGGLMWPAAVKALRDMHACGFEVLLWQPFPCSGAEYEHLQSCVATELGNEWLDRLFVSVRVPIFTGCVVRTKSGTLAGAGDQFHVDYLHAHGARKKRRRGELKPPSWIHWREWVFDHCVVSCNSG